jgi:peptide/nickel transport system ATP-binding protein
MGLLLEVDHLCVEFVRPEGRLRALDEVSFDISAGEMLGVVGESGAGKSLTGAAINGLLDPPGRITAGEVRFDGRRIDGLPESALRRLRGKEIGAIFQDPNAALNPLFSVGDQLVETLRTHLALDGPQARQRALELLRETGLTAPELRLGQYPHQLSGGMRQRVVMALAMAAGPRLLIADEPTTALDVSVQAQVLAWLRRLCDEQGLAVMLVTHDMGVVSQVCDRVAVMYAGRIVEIGPVRQVLEAPAHPYTRGLIGSVPPLDEDRVELTQIPGSMPRLDAIPPGCPFHPRCPHAFSPCASQRPPMFAVAGARAACWLHDASKGAA